MWVAVICGKSSNVVLEKGVIFGVKIGPLKVYLCGDHDFHYLHLICAYHRPYYPSHSPTSNTSLSSSTAAILVLSSMSSRIFLGIMHKLRDQEEAEGGQLKYQGIKAVT